MNAPTIVREKNYNDFLVRLQYVDPNPREIGSEHEPALVICRPKRSQVRSAWIIMLSSAWKYVDNEDTTHSKYMVMATERICDMLRLGQALETRFRVAEAIMESIEELINMPPYEAPPPETMGTIQGTIGEQKIEVEVH